MRLIKTIWICGAFCGLMGFAIAQKQEPPRGGIPKDFEISKAKTFTLDNGLKATLVHYGNLPKVNVRIVVRSGNLNEAEKEVWLADLMGDLIKEGTKTRTSDQISEQVAGMGGTLSVDVGSDLTTFGSDVLSEFGPDLVALLADVVQHPLFPESEVARLKRDMLRNLSIAKSQPGQLAQEKFLKVLYPDHPYGRMFPSPEMVASYTASKIRTFYDSNFGAQRCHVYVAGRFDEKTVGNAIRTAFASWSKGPEPLISPPKPSTNRKVWIVDRPGAPQSTLYIGLPVIDASHKDYVRLLVTNSLLGGSFASRITSNIRENKGYTYSPYSMISGRYRDAYWLEVADVGTEVTAPALKEILYEIDLLRKEPPSKEELQGIQNYMAGVFVLRNSDRGGIIGQLSFLDLHGLDRSYLTNYVGNVHAVTPEDVRRITEACLKDKEMVIVIAGDKKKILKSVSAFGPVE